MDNEKMKTDAIKAYGQKEYDVAFPLFRKIAKKGDPESLYYLGMLHYHGQGTKANPAMAFSLFKQSALELYLPSTYMLGIMYEEGNGVAQDYAKALDYFVTGSAKDYDACALKEAEFYDMGKGISKNRVLALQIYDRLRKKGNAYATYKIGIALVSGDGVKKNPEDGFNMLNRALALGSIEAMNHFRLLGKKSKEDLRDTATIYQTAEDWASRGNIEAALPYYQIAANEGEIRSYRKMADLFTSGQGGTKDLKRAFDYLLQAANAKDSDSMFELGKRYESGEGTASNYLFAAAWYERAAKNGHEAAQRELKALRGY